MKSLTSEVQSYIDSKAGQWAASTLHTATSKLTQILEIGIGNPAKLFKTLRERGYSLYTIKNYFILARTFEEERFKTFKLREWFSSNTRQFKNCYKKKSKTLTEKDFFECLKLAPSDDLYNFLILMGKGGLRKQEAFLAKWTHIQSGQLEIPSGKGDKQRFVPFSKEWLRNSHDSPSLILPKGLIYWPFIKDECDPFTPHDFRSYYATKIVNIPGMSIEDARELLGHESVETTALYLRANQEKQSRLILEHFK